MNPAASPAAGDAADLTGRVVIVTGASRGIGKGLAIGLARHGATVVCAARTVDTHPDGLPGHHPRDGRARSRPPGGTALAVRCDIGIEGDIHHLVDTTVATLRPHRRAGEQRDGADAFGVRRVDAPSSGTSRCG